MLSSFDALVDSDKTYGDRMTWTNRLHLSAAS
jgi:hypothetical protein